MVTREAGEIVAERYRLGARLGEGGMGEVWSAEHVLTGRGIALKFLAPGRTQSAEAQQRFLREARAASRVDHPAVVGVHDVLELEDGSLVMVMDLLSGETLRERIERDRRLSPGQTASLLLPVISAVGTAHQAGVVHRDLKPENIFLTTSGGMTDFAKVLDFGLAKVTERELRPGSIMLTQEGMVFGTPEFMSPEQAQGQTLDRRSDIYSLAIILYEALTGKLPFDARSSMEYIQLHVTKPPIPLDERVADKSFPAGLGDAIAKALGKSPDDRYDSATEFAEALMPFAPATAASAASLPGTSIPAAASSKPELTPSPPVISEPPVIKNEPASEPEPSTKRRPDLQKAAPAAPTQEEGSSALSSRTLILVSAISVIAGIVLAIVALKLLG